MRSFYITALCCIFFFTVACDNNTNDTRGKSTGSDRGVDIENKGVSNEIDDSKRIALVIGNGNYKKSPLKNPVNDANDMAEVLTSLGFHVTVKTDVSRKEMRRAIRQFGKDLKNGGVGLFYYAGHGMQVKGNNYLIPIGAEIEAEHEIEDEGVKAGAILRAMEAAENPMNMVFLDACRDNPFARSFRSSSHG